MACVVEGCKSHSSRIGNNNDSLTFHRLPKNGDTKIKWRQCINRPDWTSNQRICSKHFTSDSFVPNNNQKWRRLKSDAIPTLNIPNNTAYFTVKTLSLAEINHRLIGSYQHQDNLEPLKEIKSEPTAINFKTKITCVECSKVIKDDTEDPREKKIKQLEKQVQTLKNVSKRRLRKINTLTKQITRLSKKNAGLFAMLIDNLKEQENVETECSDM